MLVEIPDPVVILSVVAAFFAGLGGLFLYHKVRSAAKSSRPGDAERLEYYEAQLIDMKIRLDALEIQQDGEGIGESDGDLRQFLEKLVKDAGRTRAVQQVAPQVVEKDVMQEAPKAPDVVPSVTSAGPPGTGNLMERVLHLITHKSMTSRDIQITLRRSREHTSRLMKKLFEDGYVSRSESKPYSYTITDKGKRMISNTKPEDAIMA